MGHKRGELTWAVIPWIIALIVLALVFILYLLLSGKLDAVSDFITKTLRFG